jgi:hypothetical protein
VVLARIGPHISLGYFWAYVQPPRRLVVLSAEAAFGQPLDLPGEVTPETEASTELSTPSWLLFFPPATCQPHTYAEVAAQPLVLGLQSAELVYVKKGGSGRPLAPAYVGLYRVVKLGLKYCLIEARGRYESVSIDRLRLHRGPSLIPATAALRRGCPPGGPPVTTSASLLPRLGGAV